MSIGGGQLSNCNSVSYTFLCIVGLYGVIYCSSNKVMSLSLFRNRKDLKQTQTGHDFAYFLHLMALEKITLPKPNFTLFIVSIFMYVYKICERPLCSVKHGVP